MTVARPLAALCLALTSAACAAARPTPPPMPHRAPERDASAEAPAANAGARDASDDASAPTPDAAAQHADEAPAPAIPCAAGDVAFAFADATLDLTCDAGWQCHAETRLLVRNCRTDAPVAPHIRVGGAGGPTAIYDFDPIAPGQQVEHRFTAYRVGALEAVATFGAPGTDFDVAVVRVLRVTNSAHERARAACIACNGEWGRRGILQREGCACRMPDFGRPCEDGADCQGECLPTGVRVVERPRRARVLPDHSIAPVVLGSAVLVGRCSEFRARFGCHAYIPVGARAAGPFTLGATRADTRCVD